MEKVAEIVVISQSCLAAINRAPYRRLADLGWKVQIVAPDKFTSSGFARRAEPAIPGDPPITLLPISSDHPRLWTFRGLGELLERLQPKIAVLDVDPGSRLAVQVGRLQRSWGGVTTCISCDNMPRTAFTEMGRGLRPAVKYGLVKGITALASQYVDHVFAISNDIVEVMKTRGFGNRVSQIPLGFEPSVFFPNSNARLAVRERLGLRTTTFAYFGRLIPEKGVDLLLKALAELKDHPWQLMVDEFKHYRHPYVEQLKSSIVGLGIQGRVVYFDGAHHEIADYMNAADVIVVPSRANAHWKEQYGRVAPEAMACGKLVVVSDSGALPQLVGEYGLVFRAGDGSALKELVHGILKGELSIEARAGEIAEFSRRSLSTLSQAQKMHEVFVSLVGPPIRKLR